MAEIPAAGEAGAYGGVLRWLRRHAGLRFPESRMREVELAVEQGMRRTGARTVGRYTALLASDGLERDEFVGSLTVGETYFFREPGQLGFVAGEALPELADRYSGPLRAWSAGCAAGEEAYSLAILFERSGLGHRGRVLGTDISRRRLALARRASYRRWSLRGLPDDIRRDYFEERDGRFDLVPRIRTAAEFEYLNLAEDTYPSIRSGTAGMHLVFCRNVLIYLDADTIARVAQRLLASLSVGGWLVLAASDPPLGEYVRCETVPTGSGVAYRRAADRPRRPVPVPFGPPADEGTGVEADAAPPPEAEADPRPPAPAVQDADPVEEVREAYGRGAFDRVVRLADAETAKDAGAPEGVWIAWVRALANRGRMEEADRVCLRALERHPLSAELAYLNSVLLADAGRYGDAAAAARRALYLDRRLVVAHLALGRALARAGEEKAARRAYRNACELLQRLSPDAPVPAAEGESAARLLRYLRAELRLLGEAA